jgi:putative ATP-binding cassette transporter
LLNLIWTSEEKWSAWGLLLVLIVLNLGNAYISVRINAWNNAFYNALQALNSGELFASSTPAAS